MNRGKLFILILSGFFTVLCGRGKEKEGKQFSGRIEEGSGKSNGNASSVQDGNKTGNAKSPGREAKNEIKAEEKKQTNGEFSAEVLPQNSGNLYGVVIWSMANIYSAPDFLSDRIGYFRAGTTILLSERVKPANPKSPKCVMGWYRLVDGPGYICASKGFEVASTIIEDRDLISPPVTEEVLPYKYGRVMVDFTPLYEKIPLPEEEAMVASYVEEKKKELARQKKEKALAMMESFKKGQSKEILTEIKSEENKGLELADGTADRKDSSQTEPRSLEKSKNLVLKDSTIQENVLEEQKQGESEEKTGQEKEESPFPFVSKFLMRGFYLSIDSERVERGIKWYRTTRGKFVRYEPVMIINPPSYHGYILKQDEGFPVGIVLRKNVFARKWNSAGNHLVKNREKVLDKFFGFKIYKNVVDAGMLHYQMDPEGKDFVLSWSVAVFNSPAQPPPEIPEDSKWIHVDISEQTLTAYEGRKPVFVTLISSGNEKKDPVFATPRGLFYIQQKGITSTMSNLALDDESYLIEDVPWVMYFNRSYALHGAFWHNVFGNQRSHGCVNMTPADAKWLFYWSEPRLPLGWHGVFTTKKNQGTPVYITD